jgi:hypothetical protein
VSRTRREIDGDVFGAKPVVRADPDKSDLPERKPIHTVEADAVREAPSTLDAQVAIHRNADESYSTERCPECGYAARERSRLAAQRAYVLHRAQERARQPDLIPGSYHAPLKPYN